MVRKKNILLAITLFLGVFLAFGISQATANAPIPPSIGQVLPPPGTDTFSARAGADIGILYFISRMIRLIMVIAGVWSAIMILLAGYTFISSSGDSGSYQKVRNQLTNAIIGLVIIMFTYTIIGLISLIIFRDAGFILNPTLDPI